VAGSQADQNGYGSESTGARCRCVTIVQAFAICTAAMACPGPSHRRAGPRCSKLARIQNDESGIDRGLLGARPANAVVTVAHSGLVCPVAGLMKLGPLSQEERPGAALRHDRHVAGVEIRSIDGGSAW